MRKVRLLGAAAIAGVLALTGPSAFAGNPPGNNGTVKVDNVDLDGQPNRNEPHVGCVFDVEWYGFDADAVSQVTFKTQPPTGSRLLRTDTVQLDSDDASGGGSPAGLDAVREYTLNFNSGDHLHPMQGYHVKLTINTTGSMGADVKHKVFWVQGCNDKYPDPYSRA
jgi:hypothetical protein